MFLGSPHLYPKQDVDPFSRFAQPTRATDKQTDWQTHAEIIGNFCALVLHAEIFSRENFFKKFFSRSSFLRPRRMHEMQTIATDIFVVWCVCQSVCRCATEWLRSCLGWRLLGALDGHGGPAFSHEFDAVFAKLVWPLVNIANKRKVSYPFSVFININWNLWAVIILATRTTASRDVQIECIMKEMELLTSGAWVTKQWKSGRFVS